MKNITILLVVVIFGAFGCKSPKETSAELQSGAYKIVSISGEKVEAKEKVSLNFDVEEKRIAGNAGCNRYSAPYTTEEGKLKLGNAIATKMYCQSMSIETKFLEALTKVDSYQYEGDEVLLLLDENKNVILKGKK